MKNWDTLEADENLLMNTHYTPGRSGRNIDKIVIHHNAGNLSIAGCYNLWQTREASAHYQVDANGRIGQLVWDADTAWHADDWDANITSIGVEHADINTNRGPSATPHWTTALTWWPRCANTTGSADPVVRERVPALPVQRHRMPDQPRRHPERGLHGKSPAVVRQHDRRHPAPTPSQPATHGTNLEALADASSEATTATATNASSGSAASTTRSWQSSRPLRSHHQHHCHLHQHSVDIDGLARRVINGEFGVGDARKAPSAATTKPCRRASTSYSPEAPAPAAPT